MSQQTSHFRTTKTRNARSQEQLRSSLLAYKQSSRRARASSYHQTYGTQLPQVSVNILAPIISGLIGANTAINANVRSLYTIGIWREDTSAIYRCCFIQPEISSTTCSFPISWKPTVSDALHSVCKAFPDAMPCTLSTKNRQPQLSGRMTPYVVNMLPFEVSWGFANISGSYILFVRTSDTTGQDLLVPSRKAIMILKPYFPEYSVCVFDVKTSSFKITVSPDVTKNQNDANKNTCMYIYGDGSFRLQGKPSAMNRVCSSFRDAVHAVAESNSWNNFVGELISADS
jgi:hypothetical protein